jgi:hypothetical protein
VYSRAVFAKIVGRSPANGFAFQVEAAFWCKYMCTGIVEVPIVYRVRENGRSKFGIGEVVAFVPVVLRLFALMVCGWFRPAEFKLV